MHWCRRRVRFNEVPEKVPKVPEKDRVLEKVPGQVQRGSGEGLGGFGAEPGQVQQGSGKGSRKPWCKAKSGSGECEALVQSQVRLGFRRRSGRLWRRARGRFNRVPEKVPEKVWEALVQSQVRFNRVPKKVPEKQPLDVSECHACHTNSRCDHGDNGTQARHQDPSAPPEPAQCHKCLACHTSEGRRRQAATQSEGLSKPEDLMLQNATPLRKSAP